MEYTFKRDDSLLRKFPHMADKVAIPPGTYTATVYQTQPPDDLEANWVRERIGPRTRRIARLINGLLALTVAGVVAAGAGLCFMTWPVWTAVAGATLVLVIGSVAGTRTAAWRAAAAARSEFEMAFPSYVLRLEVRAPGESERAAGDQAAADGAGHPSR